MSSTASPCRAALAAAACALAVVLGAVAAPADAGKGVTLGAAKPAKPACPADCMVEANVTALQTRIGRRKQPFRAPRSGRIVAWSIKLGAPRRADVSFFNRSFGSSKARLSILKAVRNAKGKRLFRLVRQSPVVRLGPFFGEVTTFGLQAPLPIKKGHFVALTIPTWAPAFAVRQGGSRWLASRVRKRGGCANANGGANVDAGSAHLKRGESRAYRCIYRQSRLLYSARFIPNR